MTSNLSSVHTSATGRQPHDIRVSNCYPRPRTYTRRPFNLCHEGRYEVVQEVVVWFDCFYPDTPRLLWFCLYSLQKKPRLSCGVAPFSLKSTKEDSIVVVSVMACHLPAWPPVGTTGASLMASSSTVAAWFLAIAHFGATVAGQPVMGLRPCSTSQCWLSIPMWNLNLQLRRIAIQKWRQQRPRICSVRSLCVVSVALALIFMPGLYSTVYRATFPAFDCSCL